MLLELHGLHASSLCLVPHPFLLELSHLRGAQRLRAGPGRHHDRPAAVADWAGCFELGVPLLHLREVDDVAVRADLIGEPHLLVLASGRPPLVGFLKQLLRGCVVGFPHAPLVLPFKHNPRPAAATTAAAAVHRAPVFLTLQRGFSRRVCSMVALSRSL